MSENIHLPDDPKLSQEQKMIERMAELRKEFLTHKGNISHQLELKTEFNELYELLRDLNHDMSTVEDIEGHLSKRAFIRKPETAV